MSFLLIITVAHRVNHLIVVPFLTFSGIDFRIKTIEVDEKKVKLQVWDTAGQERFGKLSQSYYRGAHGFILCYVINNRKSFEKVEFWMEEIRKYGKEDACVILVGLKSDLSDERVVSFDEGKDKAETLGIKFFEMSAKKNLNIDETFLEITKEMSEVLSKKKNETKETGAQLHSRERKQSSISD